MGEFEQAPGVGDGQGGLACCNSLTMEAWPSDSSLVTGSAGARVLTLHIVGAEGSTGPQGLGCAVSGGQGTLAQHVALRNAP